MQHVIRRPFEKRIGRLREATANSFWEGHCWNDSRKTIVPTPTFLLADRFIEKM